MKYVFINSEAELIKLIDSKVYKDNYTYVTSYSSLKKQEDKNAEANASYFKGYLNALSFYHDGRLLMIEALTTAEQLMKCEGEI